MLYIDLPVMIAIVVLVLTLSKVPYSNAVWSLKTVHRELDCDCRQSDGHIVFRMFRWLNLTMTTKLMKMTSIL